MFLAIQAPESVVSRWRSATPAPIRRYLRGVARTVQGTRERELISARTVVSTEPNPRARARAASSRLREGSKRTRQPPRIGLTYVPSKKALAAMGRTFCVSNGPFARVGRDRAPPGELLRRLRDDQPPPLLGVPTPGGRLDCDPDVLLDHLRLNGTLEIE